MTRSEPVDPRVRLEIAQWPPDAPRGAVSTFCSEQGISRKTFYAIRPMVPVPSTASLARIFRDAGVTRVEPRKKPRGVVPAVRVSGSERVLAAGRDEGAE